jgi:hypothetical protein
MLLSLSLMVKKTRIGGFVLNTLKKLKGDKLGSVGINHLQTL